MVGIIITIVGTIASVWGAVVSIKQAKQAKASAGIAEEAKNEIISKRKLQEYSEINQKIQEVHKVFKCYGPGHTKDFLKGKTHTDDAVSVQELISDLNKHKNAFSMQSVIDPLITEIETLLENFVSASKLDDIKLNGQALYQKVDSLLPLFKDRIDNNRERDE